MSDTLQATSKLSRNVQRFGLHNATLLAWIVERMTADLDWERDADGGAAVGHTISKGVHVARLVLASQALLIACACTYPSAPSLSVHIRMRCWVLIPAIRGRHLISARCLEKV